MGTRADFYVKNGKDLSWQGSMAFDGYPDGPCRTLSEVETLEVFNFFLQEIEKNIDHFTTTEAGWPWPWDDSSMTDYSYLFDVKLGVVLVSNFGSTPEPMRGCIDGHEIEWRGFPDMTKLQSVATPGSPRSGMMMFTFRGGSK